MEFWEENKRMIMGCSAAAAVLLAVYLFFFGPMSRAVADLTGKNEAVAKDLSSYFPDGGRSVQTLKSTFELSNGKLRAEYEALKEKMTQKLAAPFVIPPDEHQPGFYFRRLLTENRYDVLFYTSTRGVDAVDRSLGFGESVPADEAVPEMLIQLASSKEIVKAAADAGIKTVSGLRHLGVKREGAPGYATFMEERGIELSMRCTLDALLKFLHSLGSREYCFGLKKLSISSPLDGEGRLLAVEMECVTFRFIEPSQPIEKKNDSPAKGGPKRTVNAPTYGL